MNKQSITFEANEQKLTKTGGIEHYASNIVAYIEATFELGENWTGYDSVRAVWSNDYLTDISTVLDPNGRCIVPTEVLTDTGNVTVNLVGSISVDDELTDRLTTYPCKALIVDADAKVEGDETESITPSQFEQFVEIVHDEVEQVTGMTAEAETLPAGSDATASYEDGVLSLGIPRGDKGEQGEQGETGHTGEPAGFGNVTASVDNTVGTPSVVVHTSGPDTAKELDFAFHNLKGDKGDTGDTGATGNGIASITETAINGAVHTYTITYTNGNTTTFDVTDGEVTNATLASIIGNLSDLTTTDKSKVVNAINEVKGETTDLKEDYNYLNNYFGSAFDSIDSPSGSAPISGAYMKIDGSISTTYSVLNYMAVNIPVNKIGYTYKVTGSAWYQIVPYVFIANDSSIVYANVPDPQGTLTQYTDLEFIPKKTGTLYINWHNNNNYGLTIKEINSLKASMIPSELMDFDGYSQLSLTIQSQKYLNGTTGAIEDSSYPNAKVSSAIPITGGKAYLITAEQFYGHGLYAFYDSSMNFIVGRNSDNNGNMTIMRFEKVIAPTDAAYLIVANWDNLFSEPYVAESGNIIYTTKKWNHKKWACIGDSLTGSGTYNYRHYYDFVSEYTGITPTILGVGGTGYSEGSTPFYTQALSVPQDADVVTIFGSFNDLGSALPIGSVDDSGTSTIAGCINKTIENILSVIPAANIGIVSPCPWSTTQPTDTGNAYNYVSMLKAICDRNSLPYLDLWHHSGLMPWNEDFASETYPVGDRVHPNEKGHSILATKFKGFLETLLF